MSKRVFITAGAGGIGKVIAESYAAQGAQVFVCDQDHAAVDALPDQIKGACVDVTDEAELDGWLQAGLALLGGCDVLINNAGVAGQAPRLGLLGLLDRHNRSLGRSHLGLLVYRSTGTNTKTMPTPTGLVL